MESTCEQYGYDAVFISEVQEYLRCVVCHLVLRNPIQILSCGHKFCKLCFERYKSYSTDMNSELCCPVDRNTIDIDNVSADKAMERIVGNLTVKCNNNENGCKWQGALTDVVTHENKCEYRGLKDLPNIPSYHTDENSPLLNGIYQKMNKFEESLFEKEKDIAFLKLNLQEVKTKFDESLVEVTLLKDQNQVMESELKLVKSQNQDLKEIEFKVENLLLKHVGLEQKVSFMENQLSVPKTVFDDNANLTAIKKEIKYFRVMVEECKTASTMCNEQLKELHLNVTDEINEIRNSLQKSSNELSHETKELRSQITSMQRKVNNNILDRNQNLIPDVQQVVKDLESHVKNIENILFCDFSNASKEIALQWKLQNYHHHFNIGKDVFSPVFFTQIEGYLFQLSVAWSGKNNGNLGIYLWLHRGKDNDEELKPFRIPFTLEMQDKRGAICSDEITSAEMDDRIVFFISPGFDIARDGFGFASFLSMPKLRHFIVNDTINIQCRFKLPYTS